MSDRDFVKFRYPKAVLAHVCASKDNCWYEVYSQDIDVLNPSNNKDRFIISAGTTASRAWENAKIDIMNEIV